MCNIGMYLVLLFIIWFGELSLFHWSTDLYSDSNSWSRDTGSTVAASVNVLYFYYNVTNGLIKSKNKYRKKTNIDQGATS